MKGNPLEDFGNLCHQAGIMVRGVWYARAELDEMVEAIRAGNHRLIPALNAARRRASALD